MTADDEISRDLDTARAAEEAAETHHELGRLDAAIAREREAVDAYRRLSAHDAERFGSHLIDALDTLAGSLGAAGRDDQALPLYAEMVELVDELPIDDSVRSTRRLALLPLLAGALDDAGRAEEAEAVRARARDLAAE